MKTPSRRSRWIVRAALALLALGAGLGGLWATLHHTPRFYRELVEVPSEGRDRAADQFVKDSLQLRNDIANEPNWEAVFSDAEVNAWLAKDLLDQFADQLPSEVKDPRVAFDSDRVTIAFRLDQGPIRTVIWVVARPRIVGDNALSLTLEKVRAGALPIPPERVYRALDEGAGKSGLAVTWTKEAGLPVVTIKARGDSARDEVVLEQVQVRSGQIRLSGRSRRDLASTLGQPPSRPGASTDSKRAVQAPPADAAPPRSSTESPNDL